MIHNAWCANGFIGLIVLVKIAIDMEPQPSAPPPSYDELTEKPQPAGSSAVWQPMLRMSDHVGGLTSVDILPNCLNPGGFFKSQVYEDFPTLLQVSS